ncbi:Response regulator receiver domain-containing protein [Pseudobutyrivibrio sp. AR14]|uniref:response regulator n=1 Tax=Pseudobutyrivibrio sp. AR14 TaxID=1520804 RepID=UPI0008831079|nr:response regulator [Pseudobutyrivibrio sp. AR14]SCX75474.1 Response regulator receiver domain-containing protein [Pseudobutyrivibrio sp. AR14]
MDKRIVLVGDPKSFMVGSIVKELRDREFEVLQASGNVDEIENLENKPSVYLVYIDEMAVMRDLFIYLKDHSIEEDISLSVVGSKNDLEQVKEIMPNFRLAETFMRPINVKDMAEKMGWIVEAEDERLQKKKILLVDDDGTMLRTLKSWLETHYQVFMVNSGMAAITFLAKNEIDLILLDYEMPITTGPQVLEMLRSEENTAKIPVMFLTNKGDKESVMNVLGLKPEKYLLKTMSKSALLGQIDEFFEKEKAKQY